MACAMEAAMLNLRTTFAAALLSVAVFVSPAQALHGGGFHGHGFFFITTFFIVPFFITPFSSSAGFSARFPIAMLILILTLIPTLILMATHRPRRIQRGLLSRRKTSGISVVRQTRITHTSRSARYLGKRFRRSRISHIIRDMAGL